MNADAPDDDDEPLSQEEYEATLDLFRWVGEHLVRFFRRFEAAVPKPKVVDLPMGQAFRYVERTPQQAIVMMLARVLAAMQSTMALHRIGQLQDSGAIRRIIDETNDNIALLAFGCLDGELTELHQQLLAQFWEEEFDDPGGDPMKATQKRPMVNRDKVRAHLANRPEAEGALDQHRRIKSAKVVQKGYSGYVHASAPHIMEMYGGEPERFHFAGMRGTPHWDHHFQDMKNYWLRTICSFGLAAAALGDAEVKTAASKLRSEYDVASGLNTLPPKK